MEICARSGLHLISDEIYALSTWKNPCLPDAAGFKSVLSLVVKEFMDPSRLHVVCGLSKNFGATGLRIGCLVSPSNRDLLEAAQGIFLYNYPSSVADQIASQLLLNDNFIAQYISTNQHRLVASYELATSFLRTHDIPYVECNAPFFIWVDLGAKMVNQNIRDIDIIARLQDKKVYIAAGMAYGAEETGWFRLCATGRLGEDVKSA